MQNHDIIQPHIMQINRYKLRNSCACFFGSAKNLIYRVQKVTDFHCCAMDGWMDGCSLRFMGVNPLYELFAGVNPLYELFAGCNIKAVEDIVNKIFVDWKFNLNLLLLAETDCLL